MSEKKISLQDFHPLEIFGIKEENLALMQSFFPNLKLIARGDEINAIGSASIISDFEKKFEECLLHFDKNNRLSKRDIQVIFGLEDENLPSSSSAILLHGVGGKIIKALSPNQQLMVERLDKNDMIFAIGPAGSGKTYTAVALAVKSLKEKQIKRIVLTRPAVEAGENLGFLPGDLKDKLDPYLQPLYDALSDMIPRQKLLTYLEDRTIEIAPLAFMRGRTLDHAFVILDEAQNATPGQMKMFLTRMGKSAKFIITGDATQIDLPKNQFSGLLEAEKLLKNIEGIDFIYLTADDVVRHKLVTRIIHAYEKR